MRIRLIVLMFLCFGVKIFAQNTSSIDFEIRNLGVNVDGFFKSFTVTTKFDDANNLEDFTGEIKANSIETGIESRDEHLLKEDYFYVSKYPLITMDVVELYKKAENRYSAKVNLRIKGKAKQITIPLKVEITDSQRKITSEFEINRRDFNVGGGSFVMSKTVKIKVVHIETFQ
ncbi:YceI family protein [Winogradskyella jejuensis]|uniref:Polyisoprenoid-binding protein YceI n=1 Tax=Winogradskyella jejuensis TaxID=1089305 RepID=A0A1M5N3I2_9FLAO|nr:YceI family protein [Winogradskyella jejuensis]SHG84007.1 Polyisoprenoid-binding protein YceI [Winogradskyella jejuensis]